MDSSAFVSGLAPQQLTALIELMLHAAEADGDFSGTEQARFARNVQKVTSGAVGDGQLTALIEGARANIAGADRATRLGSLGMELGDNATRELAFTMAVQVAVVDGRIGLREQQLLVQAAAAFGLDHQTAIDLLERASVSSMVPPAS